MAYIYGMLFETAYKQLQPGERAFVDDFISSMETVAIRSGDRLDAINPATVADNSERTTDFLARALVRAAISERVRDITDQMELSAHRVIKELSSIAFASIGDYMTVDEFTGQPHFNLASCTPEQLAAIASIEIEESPKGGRKFKFKMHDKLAGLDKFMRYMGLLSEENAHWQALNARARKAQALPVGANDDVEAAYAKRINGG